MGFIVNHKVENATHGSLDTFYVRIEMYRIDKIHMKLYTTVKCYTSADGAYKTWLDNRLNDYAGSFLIGNVKWDDEEIDLNELNSFEFSLVKEVDIEQPIYEIQTKTRYVPYFDFDDEGNVVEKEGEEEYEEEVEVGTESVTVKELDLTPIIETSIFEVAYEKVKQEYGRVFGNEYIIDMR